MGLWNKGFEYQLMIGYGFINYYNIKSSKLYQMVLY